MERKILIIEDEPAILKALSRFFSLEGFTVCTAEDGEKGLEAALRERPDLILFDIIMPHMDGITMLERIRNDGGAWGEEVKAIVYSNLSYNELRERAQNVGITDFLVKADTSLDTVVKKVKAELEQK